MGTRGAVGYFGKLNGENLHKVTYNHYDSYPSGLGKQVVEYIQSRELNINGIKNDFKKIKLVENDESNYSELRSLQGDLDGYSEVGKMIDSESFLGDSLFCEWAYIINTNTKKLEIYKGFQTSKPKGRYRDIEPYGDYYGVSLIKSIPLEDVTDKMMDDLEKEVYES
jgi:hypothetical protein